AQWGGHVKWHVTPNFYATVGAYLNNPNAGNKDQGWNLSLKHSGVFVPVEVGWSSGYGSGQLPADLKLGAYYNTVGTMAGVGDSATSRFRYFWVLGGHYQGTFPGRDNDVVSFMVASGRTNPR